MTFKEGGYIPEDQQEVLHDTNVLLRLMLHQGMIQFEETRVALHRKHPEAPVSPFSFNIRDAIGDNAMLRLVVKAYAEEIRRLRRNGAQIEALAGIPQAVSPYMGVLSLEMGLPLMIPRLEVKEDGVGQQVAGRLGKNVGLQTLVVDDVFSSGGSKEKAVSTLRGEDVVVRDLFVLLDRSNGWGKDRMWRRRKVKLHAGLTADKLFMLAYSEGHIKFDKYKKVKEQQEILNKWMKENEAV